MSLSPVVANDDVLIRAKAALWRAGEFGVVVLAPGAASPVILEGTGSDLWELLARPSTRQELVLSLAKRFFEDVSVVDTDMSPVLEQLLYLGIVETQP